ncbi:uncharacterized protein J8A68_002148 [[Candida] subhashii]|uniref:Zn(2)-C6 fungal-type domain-containing protein n=1 Tax=[Candida] subhashii TaxID=561895 RepID=A0A8J5QMN8_9ASCO|nr:uncharacterized protein J8A68_002148 [[Candida] subhashii]KAG7664329.1 hypothetical protein J8A68_002148 [[Candida] subhashii]
MESKIEPKTSNISIIKKDSVSDGTTQFITTNEPRKKVSKACDYCKKRKYKCSGIAPCNLCTKKKIQCQFSSIDGRSKKGSITRHHNQQQRELQQQQEASRTTMMTSSRSNGSTNSTVTDTTSQISRHELPIMEVSPGTIRYDPTVPQQQMSIGQQRIYPTQVPFPHYQEYQPSQQQQHQLPPPPQLNQNGRSGYTPLQPTFSSISSINTTTTAPLPPPVPSSSRMDNTNTTSSNNSNASTSISNPSPGSNDGRLTPGGSDRYIPKSLQPLLSFPLEETKGAGREKDDSSGTTSNSEEDDEAEPNNKTQEGGGVQIEKSISGNSSNGIRDGDEVVRKRRRSELSDHSDSRKRQEHQQQSQEVSGGGSGGGSVTSPTGSTKSAGAASETSGPKPKKGLSNDRGKSTRLLYDSAGNLRYIGESSPLSLLFDCRNIFTATIGQSEFTGDPQGVNIIDGAGIINQRTPMQLPKREHCNIMVKFFENNINQTWYVFNMKHFKVYVVDYIYDNPIRAEPEKLALLHLVLAVGLLFAEKAQNYLIEELEPTKVTSMDFFESGFNLMRNIIDDGKLWLSQAYFLIYFYYQSTSKRSSSWLMLSTAIRNAQALGLHRKVINESFRDQDYITHRRKLWKSLYICDRISSILLGRPLLISDYDWDDFEFGNNTMVYHVDGSVNLVDTCLNQNAHLASILGKIIQHFYIDGIVDLRRAERIAIDLKLWSINLPSDVQIDKMLVDYRPNHAPSPTDEAVRNIKRDNYSLLLMHMSQLYGIMLLGKPFFMYQLFKRKNEAPNYHSRRSKQEAIMSNFCSASIKSSVLMIQLIHFYKEHNPQRMESYVTVNCCFKAALILGLTILYRQTNEYEPDEYTIDILAEKLMIAKSILLFYSSVSATSARFHSIITKMYKALETAFRQPKKQPTTKKSEPVFQPQQYSTYPMRSISEHTQIPIPTPFQQNGSPMVSTPFLSHTHSHRTQPGGHQHPLQQEQTQTSDLNLDQGFESPESVTSNPPTQFARGAGIVQSQLQSPSSFPTTFEIATTSELENLMNFQQFFVPSVTNSLMSGQEGGRKPQERREEEGNNNGTGGAVGVNGGGVGEQTLDAFMYNIGINDLLFEGSTHLN